ncbi:Predicted dehydrogenase [Microlunatus sagamiharensis]|uniref:Predicted dehydrogenase n=1 Tax=Microlunatus sagamiharensis TaxID=546874 RepID=A0A1H2NGT5_9ACTN|nr:Gfo/Idh/MocA family oxidoreductase [Microlunatus sagamiharensis]SDV04325.1 Predicted dehydrogenase [Microlunatus sagamiharensis]
MIRVGLVGLGKMGLSHVSIVNAHPDVQVTGICDATGYLLSVLGKYTGLPTYDDFDKMIAKADLDAVVIATPSAMHGPMVRKALEAGLHVFCEKPFCLDPEESEELAALARSRGLVTQVGYHYRYVGAFAEVKRLVDAGAIGKVTHLLAEAYGPVVLKPQGSTWRTKKTLGGGSLYDYAAHPLNLVNWYAGETRRAGGSVLKPVFSRETDDEVFSTLFLDDDVTAQLSINWSDESQRKMSTKITIWGTQGRISADRQEVQAYLRDGDLAPAGYTAGWNVKYTTELTDEVWFYVRGEEYSAQVDAFVSRVEAGKLEGRNNFDAAAVTDRSIAMIVADASGTPATARAAALAPSGAEPEGLAGVAAGARTIGRSVRSLFRKAGRR